MKISKLKLQVPHTLVLLFFLMLLGLLATYILPQGQFQTETNVSGREVVIPGSFQELPEKNWLMPWHVFLVVPRAFADAQNIIFFVFIIGGVLQIIRATGTIDAFLGKMLEKFSNKTNLLIFGGMLIFSVGSSTIGMAEEYIPFVAILVALCLALKLDRVTAIGIMVAGYGVGYGVAAINPFTLIIAQGIAELEPTSGIWFRLILFVPFFALAFHHVVSYASRVKADPAYSLVSDLNFQEQQTSATNHYPPLTNRHLLILLFTFLAIGLIVYGISDGSGWHWYLDELGAVFLGLGIITTLVARMKPDTAAKEFAKGASDLTTTALLIGFARSIALIMEDGMVLHTIINALANPLQQVGPHIASVGMYMIQSVINFFVPSGSGQAYITMPIMTPIADLTGVSRQIAVLAFQFGDGFTNMLVPTNAVLMGILGIANIPYDRWFKFILPLMIKFWILGSIALMVAVWIGYS